ncbi:calcium/sodium antiporter [Donghicola eburneus]|uniref:Putative membrane protein n=1 Tax=Donghicola eburneus TaxID=393278 RepID=A0A1M4N705_9RHOB|nr:calcium/sodium antiporter [Donghicola eburneus]SCM68926.1 putative membrane protein [Donghicola eburneus]SFQ39386.1 cation:H+ antiporter [Donghicola eburneus]
MEWLMAGVGLLILILAGDFLVKGAVNLSLRIGIPSMIVSLTVVAFGTSAPELLISIRAVLDNVPGIALGNVVGSNTANILMVLGIPALLATMHTSECDSRKSFVMMIAGSLLFIALAFTGILTWWTGLILLAALAHVLGDAIRDSYLHRKAAKAAIPVEEEVEGADPSLPWWRILFYLSIGLIGLPVGAQILVENAQVIAREFGVSDTVIGLTLVALGTSLPELATTTMAAIRRQADVALGNVIGSNLFNLLAIIGVASLVGPIPVDPEFLRVDLWVMLGASLLLIPFVFMKMNITKVWGILFCALYGFYVVSIVT